LTEYLAATSVQEDSIQLQQGVIRRNKKVGVECNCACRVKRIRGPNSARLQIELLELKPDCSGCQVEN
jgi:hypothetical protein